MKVLRAVLRVVGLVGVIGGSVDPGCATTRRPSVEVVVLDAIPDPDARMARLADAAPWADLRRVSPHATSAAPPAAARILLGDAGAVLTALRERGAALAMQASGEALALAHVGTAVDGAVGSRSEVLVALSDLPARRGRVLVHLTEAATGTAVASTEVDVAGDAAPVAVRVPWIPARPGLLRLRATAAWSGEGVVRRSAPADVDVYVRDLRVAVDVLEARPSWSARFARLALEGARGVTVRSESRVAPGLVTGTDATAVESADAAAALTIVGGVDALTARDVTRLLADVQDRGRTVVLVLDAPPDAGPFTRLWPSSVGPVRRSSTPSNARLGPHVWHVREWLAASPATDARPLAYLDEGTPIVWGRALGAGRLVLVVALDAWRWRADDGADFPGGWRALITSLALDQPAALSMRPWLAHTAEGRAVGLAVTSGPASMVDEVRITPGEGLDAWGRALVAWSAGPGQWRAMAPWPSGPTLRLTASGRREGRVVAEDAAVIDVSPPAPVGQWTDVVRHQAGVGALAATEVEAPGALSALRAALNAPVGARWYVTRTWGYAALVLAALGTEWILRRLHRER